MQTAIRQGAERPMLHAAVATPAQPRAGARRLTLRVTLQALVVGLLVASGVGIGLVSILGFGQSIETLQGYFLSSAATSVANSVRANFDAGPRTLATLKLQAEHGRLPLDDLDALGTYFADRLRSEPTLSQLVFADAATGSQVGARRMAEDQMSIGLQELWADGGEWRSWLMAADGSRTPTDLGLPLMDWRERDWYVEAMRARGDVAWLQQGPSVDGIPRQVASISVIDRASGAPRGALAATFFLDALPGLLRDAVRGRPGLQAVLYSRQGDVLATSQPTGPERLAAARQAVPAAFSDLALGEPIPWQFQDAGTQYVGGLQGFLVSGDVVWFVGFFVPDGILFQAIFETQRTALALGGVLLLLGVVLGAVMSARIARPLRLIAEDLTQIAQFRLSTTPSPNSFVREVAVVADAADRMKASLRSFGRYVPADLVRDLLARGDEAQLGGEARCVTIHFSDIEGFTHISEHLTPAEVVENLADYLADMTDTIREQQGTIDKFIGDGIMAFWNAPHDVPDHAARACRAALAAQARLHVLRQRWAAVGKPLFKARIGLHTSEVVVGNFGTADRFAYTAMGDGVNLASRLEGLNKGYGTYIVASAAVRDAAGPGFEWRRLDRVAVVGRSEGTDVYELLGEQGGVDAAQLHARDLYEQALGAYFARRFEDAAAAFDAAAAAFPSDQAASRMARRAEQLAHFPTPDDWNGVFTSTSK